MEHNIKQYNNVYITDKLDFGRYISNYRESQNITQVQLAKLSGLKQPQISRIEKNSNIKVSTLMKVFNALNLIIEPEGVSFPFYKYHNEIMLGSLIAYQRKKMKITQMELANRTKLKQPQIVHIEKNSDITLHTFQKILKELELKIKIVPHIKEKTG